MLLVFAPVTLLAAPKFPPPPQAKIGILGDDMVVNGIPTEIRQFATSKSIDDVVEFYKELWEGDDKDQPEYTVSDALPPWKIVTHIEDDYLLTVQVASDGKRGSSGYLAVSPLIPEKKPELGKNFPMMRGSKVINDISSTDSGKKGRTLLFRNSNSVQSNANFYKNHFEKRGWAVEMDNELYKGKTHSLRFRNGNKHVTLVLKIDRGGTTVTSQSVTESIF
ncbi:MAG: hypothetical protein AAF419_00920 [Pseudomonadota bacterium]